MSKAIRAMCPFITILVVLSALVVDHMSSMKDVPITFAVMQDNQQPWQASASSNSPIIRLNREYFETPAAATVSPSPLHLQPEAASASPFSAEFDRVVLQPEREITELLEWLGEHLQIMNRTSANRDMLATTCLLWKGKYFLNYKSSSEEMPDATARYLLGRKYLQFLKEQPHCHCQDLLHQYPNVEWCPYAFDGGENK